MNIEELEKLAELQKKGIITEEEFLKKKNEILNSPKQQGNIKQMTKEEKLKDLVSGIKESLYFLGLEVLALLSIPIYAIVARESVLYHLIWIIPWIALLGWAGKYARKLHDLYYEGQNLIWYKDSNTFRNHMLIITGLVLLVAPIFVPILVIYLSFQIWQLKKKQ